MSYKYLSILNIIRDHSEDKFYMTADSLIDKNVTMHTWVLYPTQNNPATLASSALLSVQTQVLQLFYLCSLFG